ncbi:hypothetical protein H9Y04_44475 [Streptomyces sp. TRM66268-LWL]|uniref:Transposase IS204/IS1001/IS1096/IS1165 DDE domain-containing protein n=1 Tax=Streptomyces polyasparticus TaxID=2767826 RepID=A0ABR7SVN7_9ACTN|nr:hypothetical protein [Streptomyces polyasparticus]MBC9719565.1 hypothetical protein [Streptomyces polyasparticus]
MTTWLRERHCRDSAGSFAQATLAADLTIVQVMDRWHVWRGLVEAVAKEVTDHSSCWGRFGPPVIEGILARNTRGSRSMIYSRRVLACWSAPVGSA